MSHGCRGKRLSPKISDNFHFLVWGDIINILKLSKVSNILKVLKVIRVEYETSLETMNKTLFMSLLCLMKIDNIVLTKVPNIKNTVSKSLTWEIREEISLNVHKPFFNDSPYAVHPLSWGLNWRWPEKFLYLTIIPEFDNVC